MNAKSLTRFPVLWCLAWCWGHCIFVFPAIAQTNQVISLERILEKWGAMPLTNVVQAASGGDTTAQHYLGFYYMEGTGGVTNHTEGLKWYRMAAEREFPNSQNNLGVAYLKGTGVKRDDAMAAEWFKQAAEKGFPGAMGNLSSMMRDRKYREDKYGQLRSLLETGAGRGDPDAQLLLGRFLIDPPDGGIIETDNAVYWYKKAFAGGRTQACFHIGQALIGNSDSKTRELAFLWYQKGAELGDESCMAAVAWAFLGGRGVKQDGQKGLEIGLDVAGKGHRGMMYMLATYYAHEEIKGTSPLPRDMSQAMKWYRESAEKGYEPAMVRLGSHLLEEANQKSWDEGLKWLQQAEAAGSIQATRELAAWEVKRPGTLNNWVKIENDAWGANTASCNAMSNRYRHGHGVPVDVLHASLWLLNANTVAFRELWDDVPGMGEQGELKPSASAADQQFGKVYADLLNAILKEDRTYFRKVADEYEKGEKRPKSLVFSAVFGDLAARCGDAEFQKKLPALRSALSEEQTSVVDKWLKMIKRFEVAMKRK